MQGHNEKLQWCLQKLHCSECFVKLQTPLKCSRCKVVYYCSQAHQISNSSRHKNECLGIKAATKEIAEELAILDETAPNFIHNKDKFGRLSLFADAYCYMSARYCLTVCLERTNTQEGIEAALAEGLSYLEYSQLDEHNIKDLIVLCYTRLQRFQEMNDFIQWWLNSEPDYNWWKHENNPSMDFIAVPKEQFLNLKNSDCLEPISPLALTVGKGASLSFRVGLAIMKHRLYEVLQEYESFDVFLQGKYCFL